VHVGDVLHSSGHFQRGDPGKVDGAELVAQDDGIAGLAALPRSDRDIPGYFAARAEIGQIAALPERWKGS
jgi:hypothetical protein